MAEGFVESHCIEDIHRKNNKKFKENKEREILALLLRWKCAKKNGKREIHGDIPIGHSSAFK